MLAAVLLAGCLGEPREPVRIGLNPWPGYDFLYLAAEKGWIREAGGDVEIVAFTSLADSRRAFERGQLDAFGGTTVELLLAREQSSRRPRAFYVTNWSEGADEILARPPARRLADLRGKRVGVEPASLSLLVLATALERAGMAASAVDRVALPQTEMAAAMADGRIDAAVSYPPVSQTLKERFNARPVFDTTQAPRAVLDLLIADARALQHRPRDFVAVVRAFDRAVRFAARHPGEGHRIMGRREGLTPSEVAAVLDGIRVLGLADQRALWAPDGAVASTLERTAAVLGAGGYLPPAPEAGNLAQAGIVRAAEGPR